MIININAPGRFDITFDTDDPPLEDETILITIDGEPAIGITSDAVGHWPDGENWVVLK